MSFPSFSVPFFVPCPNPQIIANHHMQSISFASGGDPVSWGTGQWGESRGLTSWKRGCAGIEVVSGKAWVVQGPGVRWAVKLS